MSPSTKRALRTAFHTLLSLIVILPLLATSVPLAGKGAGVVAAVTVISKLINTLEDQGLIPAWLKTEPDVSGMDLPTGVAAAAASTTMSPASSTQGLDASSYGFDASANEAP